MIIGLNYVEVNMNNTITVDGIEIPIEKLEALGFTAPKQPKSSGRVKPVDRQKYWMILLGRVDCTTWYGCSADELHWAEGNVYPSKEEAQKVLDQRIATTKVLDRLRELDAGSDEVDWSDKEQRRFVAFFSYEFDLLDVDHHWTTQYFPTNYYTTKRGAWETIISEMPEDVRLILGVEGAK